MTKVAVGCADTSVLDQRQRARAADLPALGAEALALTRFMPKRAGDLLGGSLFWIIKHRLVARQEITGLAMTATPWGEKCAILLRPGPVPVLGTPKKAHQGWRYFDPADAPRDLVPGEADDVPVAMLRELQALWLV